MPTTVGRLKQGNLLLAGEVNERILPVTNGLIGHYPLDGDAHDKLTEYKTKSIIMTNRDWSAPIFPSQNVYKSSQWLVTGKIRCTAAADWTVAIGIGFMWNTNLVGAADSYNWIKGKNWACQDVKEWTEFAFVQTIGTNYSYSLRPWAQINITAGTAGYRVEYMDVNYKLLTDMDVSTNTQFNEEGALVQKASTNRIDPSAIINDYPSEWKVETIAPYTYKITALINGPTVAYPVRTGFYSAAANEAVTLSAELLYKSKPGMAMGCSGFGYLQDTSSGGGMYGKRTYRMIKHTAAWNHSVGLCYVNASAQSSILVGDYMIVRMPQIESAAFPTSFMETTRADAHLRFTTPPMLGNHTLHFEYRHPDLSGYGSNMVIASSYNGSNAGNWFGLNASTNNITAFNGTVVSPTKVWNKATFTYDGATTTFYLNGVQRGTFTGKFFFNADVISFSSMYGWNTTTHLAAWGIRNIAIYSRALTTAEITKLTKPPFSIKKDGKVTNAVKEGNNSLPSGAYHFPFGHDAMDITHSVTPYIDTNSVYEDGAMWVGKSITNLSDVNWVSSFQNAGTATRTTDPAEMPRLFSNAPVYSYQPTAVDGTSGIFDGVLQVGYTGTVPVSTVFSASVWVWLDLDPTETGKTIYLREYWDGSNGGRGTLTYNGITNPASMPQRKWIRVKVENVTSRADLNPNLRINMYLAKTTSRIYFTAPQIEQSAFISPFTVGTRGQGRVGLPTDLIAGSNFAFSMWARCDGFDNTYNMPFDAYPHLYVAMRDTKRLHFSFENNATQSSIYPTEVLLVTGKWHHIAGIKTSAKIEMYLDGKLIGSHTSSGTGYNTAVSDSNISIGCYNTAYPLNGYVRDLIIEKDNITLDANKILDIYKSQLRAYKDNRIQVQHQVKEGVL